MSTWQPIGSGARLKPDGSHGPLKCGTSHRNVNTLGMPPIAAKIRCQDRDITLDFARSIQRVHATAPDRGGESAANDDPAGGDGLSGKAPPRERLFSGGFNPMKPANLYAYFAKIRGV